MGRRLGYGSGAKLQAEVGDGARDRLRDEGASKTGQRFVANRGGGGILRWR